MPHHQHHQHAPRAAQVVETVVNVVYVTADSADAAGNADSAAPTTHRENGHPQQNTRQQEQDTFPTQVNSYPTFAVTSATYNAPAGRQQRPEPSSSAIVSWSGNAALGASNTIVATSRQVGSPIQQQHTTMVPMVSSSFLAASSATGLATSFNLAAPLASSTSAASTPEKTDSGMSGGAKAGIAFGVILAIALVAGVAFFIYRRKKSQNDDHQRLDDEKTDLAKRPQSMSNIPVTNNRTVAPRLSLRPVETSFPPQMSEKSNAGSFAVGSTAAAAAGVPRSRTPEPAAENPFGDHAEAKDVIATPATAAAPTPVTPKLDQVSQPTPTAQGQAFPGAPAGSRRNSPPGPGPNNVHRIQLDFKPSMDDELELKAGNLVRLLHEYDDGWALCIRLDRSQQGVVPRTCISKLPVKPRPSPPGARGPAPQGRPRGPSNAPSPRMAPPNGAARPMPPPGARIRAQSNAPRSGRQSPGPFQGPAQSRARSNSDAMSARRITPPSPMNPTGSAPSSPPQAQGQMPARKPVPGQAM